nr:immunoglobulin heavy chain junction region [Mus musculus]
CANWAFDWYFDVW